MSRTSAEQTEWAESRLALTYTMVWYRHHMACMHRHVRKQVAVVSIHTQDCSYIESHANACVIWVIHCDSPEEHV